MLKVYWPLAENTTGLFESLMFLRTVKQFFCAVCMQAMTHSVANVPSQQAVKLVVVGLGFVEQCWFRLFWGDQLQRKMG